MYYTEPESHFEDEQLSKAVYHAIELNEIRLALKRSQQLAHWIPETEIPSRNELTGCGYRKDYDALVTVRMDAGERRFALEYERSPKARPQYVHVCAAIAAERSVNRFRYLAPNYDLLFFLISCFANLNRLIHFGLARDFVDKLFDMPLYGPRQRGMTTLRDVLRGRNLLTYDSPQTDCNGIAVSLPAIGVFEPVISPTASVSYLLITLYVRVFWPKNDGAVARVLRTSGGGCEALRIACCALFQVSGHVLLHLQEDPRVSCARVRGEEDRSCTGAAPLAR